MTEKTPEEQERLDYLINKWSKVLEFNESKPLSTYRTTAMLIESQERWITPEEMKKEKESSKIFYQEYCCELVEGGDK